MTTAKHVDVPTATPVSDIDGVSTSASTPKLSPRLGESIISTPSSRSLDRLGDLTVRIVSRKEDANGITKYNVRVNGPHGSHVVRRRYTDFEVLHRELFETRCLYREKMGRSAEEGMPPKSYLKAKYSPKFKEERQARLENIVVSAVQTIGHSDLEECPRVLRGFLGLDEWPAPVKSTKAFQAEVSLTPPITPGQSMIFTGSAAQLHSAKDDKVEAADPKAQVSLREKACTALTEASANGRLVEVLESVRGPAAAPAAEATARSILGPSKFDMYIKHTSSSEDMKEAPQKKEETFADLIQKSIREKAQEPEEKPAKAATESLPKTVQEAFEEKTKESAQEKVQRVAAQAASIVHSAREKVQQLAARQDVAAAAASIVQSAQEKWAELNARRDIADAAASVAQSAQEKWEDLASRQEIAEGAASFVQQVREKVEFAAKPDCATVTTSVVVVALSTAVIARQRSC